QLRPKRPNLLDYLRRRPKSSELAGFAQTGVLEQWSDGFGTRAIRETTLFRCYTPILQYSNTPS
ncbi:MAG: hypothetical protein V3W17_08375, partial [Desulfobacteria bacterium]